MPPDLRADLSDDPEYQKCARLGPDCDGRITWEHAITYAGRQVQKRWAILPLCEFHHSVNKHQDGGNLNKEINRLLCYRRGRISEWRRDYPKAVDAWVKEWKYLEQKYGKN